MMIGWEEMILRLVTALVLTGAIGLERSGHYRSSGLRTHILVGLGAALITLTSIYGFPSDPTSKTDPARLSAQIVSGIGFLGAGAILRYGNSVRGLTTAASLWTAAGIGIAAGCGFWQPALATMILVIFTLKTLERFEAQWEGGTGGRQIWLYSSDMALDTAQVQKLVQSRQINVRRLEIAFDDQQQSVISIILWKRPPNAQLANLLDALAALPGITRVET